MANFAPDEKEVPTRCVLELFLDEKMKNAQMLVEKQITKETGFVVPRKQISRRIYYEGIYALAEKFNLSLD